MLYIIGPIIAEFKRKTGCKLRLRRKKKIVSTNNETGGIEEFVVMDRISEKDNRFVLVVGAGGGREAMKQCLKDARAGNGGGVVYGFFTTGETWRMLKYDGIFQMSEKMEILFNTMDDDKERWMKSYSILVDCMYTALSNGGFVHRDFRQVLISKGIRLWKDGEQCIPSIVIVHLKNII